MYGLAKIAGSKSSNHGYPGYHKATVTWDDTVGVPYFWSFRAAGGCSFRLRGPLSSRNLVLSVKTGSLTENLYVDTDRSDIYSSHFFI